MSALQLRTGCDNRFRNTVKLLEVFGELTDQIIRCSVISALISPGFTWIQQFRVNTRNKLSTVRLIPSQMLGLNTNQRTVLNSRDNATGSWNAEAGAGTVGTAGPSRC